MIRSFAAFAMIGVLLLGFAASGQGQEYARWPRPEPIKRFTEVLGEVQLRPDYGSFGKVFYDRMNREYKITYVKKDGTTMQVRIDAVSGKQRGRAWQH